MNNENIFDSLLGKISWEEFINLYWQKSSYHVDRNDPGYFESLVSREEIDFLINTHGGKSDFVISLIGGKINNPNNGAGHKARSYWTAANTYDAFAKGSTIRIGNIASHSLHVRKLQQHFEAHLQADVNINLYLTPPASRAFGAHFDDHDVFIVQIGGSKVWKLFSPPEEAPVEVLYRGRVGWLQKELPGQTRLHPLPTADKEWTVTMRAGDLLYVPRGHMHQVYSEDEESLHLTVAISVVTWYEVVVHALLETLKNSDILREALPPNMSQQNFRSSYFIDRIRAVKSDLQKHLTTEIMLDSLDEMTRQFIISRQTFHKDESGLTFRKENIGLSSEIRIRRDIVYRRVETLREIILYYSGGHLVLPYQVSETLEYLLDKNQCIVKDLPTHISEHDTLNLVKLLVEAGFLELVH